MTTKAHRCPVCLQVLNDPAALDRVHQNIQKLQAKQDAAFRLKEAELRASMKAEQRKAERATEAKLRKAYASKVADADAKARREERQKTERNRLQLEAKLEDMQRKLERQKPDDLGEIGEADVRKLLHEAFPGDHIERLGKSRGSADIRHEVREQGRTCGVIIYEVKNVSKWSGEYVKQAKKSLTRVARLRSASEQRMACLGNRWPTARTTRWTPSRSYDPSAQTATGSCTDANRRTASTSCGGCLQHDA
jgi:Uncharacterized protein conserved in bacteria (DUF2130)